MPPPASGDMAEQPGLLPPDGVAWPPEPPPVVAPPEVPEELATVARRPDAPEMQDWRTMPLTGPDGYAGTPGAPALPARRMEPWAVAGFVCALVGAIPYLWPVPALPVLAIGFGIAGRRGCQLDLTRRGAWLAAAAVGLGGLTLCVIAGFVASGGVVLFG